MHFRRLLVLVLVLTKPLRVRAGPTPLRWTDPSAHRLQSGLRSRSTGLHWTEGAAKVGVQSDGF